MEGKLPERTGEGNREDLRPCHGPPVLRKRCGFRIPVVRQTDLPPAPRAPLFLFVLPFGTGILAAGALPGGGPLPAAAILILLLSLLAKFPVSRNRWVGYFVPAAVCLGFLFGQRAGPAGGEAGEAFHPRAPREESLAVDPVRIFVSPPFSETHVGLARTDDRGEILYFQAPASPDGGMLLKGFAWELHGIHRALDREVLDPGFLTYLRDQGAGGAFVATRPPVPLDVERTAAAVFSVLREKARAALAAGSDASDPATRVYQALVLGQRLGLEPEQKAAFRDTGTAHLFAISGLHIGLIAAFLFGLFRAFRIRGGPQVMGALSILLFYVLLTGAAPSAVRAYLMVAFLTAAPAIGRGYRPESALAASAFVVLLFFPEQLATLGFQLSYTVVLSILVFGVPLSRDLIRRTDPPFLGPDEPGSRWRRPRVWLLSGFAVSFSAFLASAPMSIDHFGVLPVSAVALNLLLILPATAVLVLGFLSLFSGLLGLAFLCAPLNAIARPLIEAMAGTVSTVAALPFSSMPLVFPAPWMGPAATIAFLAIAFWTASRPAFRKRYLGLPLGLIVVCAVVCG